MDVFGVRWIVLSDQGCGDVRMHAGETTGQGDVRRRSSPRRVHPRKVGYSVRTFARAFTLASIVALTGCNLLQSPPPPNETYDIVAPERPGVGGATEAQILVKVPTALKAYDTDRIVFKPSPRVITYVAGAQWLDTAPRLIQARLVEVFENTGRTGATAQPGDGLVIDFQLIPTLRRFEIVGERNEALLELSIKLLTDRTGQVVQTRIFTARARVSGSEPDDYVRALDAAFDQAAAEIVAWVLRAI